MERLRVAIDATPLLGTRTGVGAFVAGVLPVLGEDPTLDVAAYALSMRGRGALATRLPPGVRAVHRPMAANALLRAWSRADLPPAEWWTGTVDVVHGTNFAVPPARRAAEVATVHDLTPWRFPELVSPHSRPTTGVVQRAVGRGATIHTPSAFVASEVVEVLGADPERVHAVHHGITPAIPARPQALDALGGLGAVRYVLALGTVEPRKGLPTLVRAFDAVAAAHTDLRLVIAGPEGWGEDDLEAAVGRARHRDRIVRLGWLDTDTRTAVVECAAVFAFPSLYEGFGFPPLEAMSAGVPVVATRAGALPEVLGDGACLVPPGDHEALAEALGSVLVDYELRSALIERGRRRASHFTWKAAASGLTSLYRRAGDG